MLVFVARMKNTDIANNIKESVVDHFGNNLVSVLLYGSSLSLKNTTPIDLDIIIVLKERESPEDLLFLGSESLKYDVDVDLQILNLTDINSNSFSHDTHGQFILLFLHEAQSLYGENPFLNFFPTYTQCVTSVLQKAQYYYFRAKKLQLSGARPSEMRDVSFHRKKLILMLTDFWLAYSGNIERLNDQDHFSKIIEILTDQNVDSNEMDFLFNKSSLFNWDNIFLLYQKYYFAILDKLRPKVQLTTMFVENIYTELSSVKSEHLAIIASGCPSDYDERELVRFLNIRGYDVVNFHYSATGRSRGVSFYPPQDDLSEVVCYYKKNYKNVLLIGNSYGGYAALSLSEFSLSGVDKIIAVSPVIDFKRVKNISTLPHYLNRHHPGWYRFKEQEFENFIQNSSQLKPAQFERIAILHGEFDDQVGVDEVELFCKTYNIELKIVKVGHLSFNRLTRERLDSFEKLL